MKKQSKDESDPMSSAWKIYVQRYGPKFNSYYSNYQFADVLFQVQIQAGSSLL